MRFGTIRAAVWRFVLRLFLSRAQSGLLRREHSYQDWIQHNGMNHWRRLDLASALIEQQERLPSVSVIMPVYRPDLALLTDAITSLQQQSFDAWQLCICDDGSNDPELSQLLDGLARNDQRIRTTSLPSNAGISAASNAAVRISDGDVLLFLDQDDLLSEDCLAEFALVFATGPHVDLAYSDHDKVDRNGHQHSPQFKPAWSPTLLLSHMYCGHALALRRSLFDAVGGMRSEFDGSQDYDLVLRATENAREIRHIPKILYHWRAMPGSTAVAATEKPGSIAAGQACLTEALVRRNLPAQVVWSDWARTKSVGLFELAFAEQDEPVTIVVFEDDSERIEAQWLDALHAVLPTRAQVVTLPGDGTALGRRLCKLSKQLQAQNVVLVRAGTWVPGPTTIVQIVGFAALPGTGLAGPLVVDSSGRVASAGLVLPEGAEALEAAFAGADRNRSGMCYFTQAAHECIALPAICIALHRSHTDLLRAIPHEITDHWALGRSLSEALRARGGTPICAAGCTVKSEVQAAKAGQLVSTAVDHWYNSNLGSQPWQFQPIRRGSTPYQTACLKVAVLAHNLDREGAQLMLLALLSGLCQDEMFEVIVFSPKDGALRDELEAAGVGVELIASPGNRAGGKALDKYIDQLAYRFRSGSFHAVLANTLDSFPAVLGAERAGLRSIWWQHEGGPWSAYFRKLRWPTRSLAYAAFALPYRVVQVAESTRQKWLPIATRANFEVIRNGIEARRIELMTGSHDRAQVRAELGVAEGECCILLVGSVSARKGQADMLAAVRSMPESAAAKIRAFIVGEHVDRSYCSKLADGVERMPPGARARFTLVGPVDDPSPYYTAADVFVCCSRQESAPRAIAEAMAFGLPIVATAVDGIPELVAFGKNAISYQAGNSKALSDILTELAASPIERERLGQASRDQVLLVNNHQKMVSRFRQILREAAMLRSTEL